MRFVECKERNDSIVKSASLDRIEKHSAVTFFICVYMQIFAILNDAKILIKRWRSLIRKWLTQCCHIYKTYNPSMRCGKMSAKLLMSVCLEKSCRFC